MNELILALAVYRVTRLLIDDKITETPRLWLRAQLDPHGKPYYLVNCYWCAGLYVAAFGVLAYWLFPVATIWVALIFAISTAVGFLGQHLT